ncbi:PREDICTED: NADH dehydrogenase [Prunus dulcis]|uniref:PREDICTED: NADH dehydrogenase n=1 Tax=Prunus dulcis TaxID=3755 RepID=A0A5E4FF35_PRUDU|nr:PREDICTED: NADH dehydrogenase [Prunus dulcis]
MGGGHGEGTTYKGFTVHQPKRWHTLTGKGMCAMMWFWVLYRAKVGDIPGRGMVIIPMVIISRAFTLFTNYHMSFDLEACTRLSSYGFLNVVDARIVMLYIWEICGFRDAIHMGNLWVSLSYQA